MHPAIRAAIFVMVIAFPSTGSAQPPNGAPNSDRPGPWDNDVLVYRTSATGRPEQLATFERAGVPTVARLKDGRLIAAFQHFPQDDNRNFDRVAVRFSSDEGRTWTKPEPIVVDGLEAGLARPFDPTLVPLPDGRIRLYFTSNRSPDFRRSIPAIYSAISEDGIRYTFEPGVRFAVDGRLVIDCAVALHDGVFHLIVPDNGTPEDMQANQQRREPARGGAGYHAVSRDGLKFERVADVALQTNDRWLGNMQSDDGRLVFFGTGGGNWPVTSADGVKWEVDANAMRIPGADPGAVKLQDGSWLLVVTGPPRPGTLSSQRRPGPPTNQPPFGPPGRGPGDPRSEFGVRPDGTLDLAMLWSRGQATAKGPVRFTHAPMRLEDIERITPYGLMIGGHVCPIDHGYFYPKPLQRGEPHFDVFAPADGHIVMIGHRTQLAGSTERQRDYDDYALHIEHSGTFYTFYDLLTQLDPAILRELDRETRERFERKQMGPPVMVRIPVKAGQVVGKIGGRSLDIAVINTEVTLKGFLSPKLYGHYAWRVHVVDPFDYFDEPLKSRLLRLNTRKAPPPFGKIDYDVDGKLVGNWFQEGTGGYAGDRRDPRGYWMGHLAFAYHHVEPSVVIVSIGDFDGKPRQFAVAGNGPDPATISVKDGLVKYDLLYASFNSNGDRIELPPQMRGVQGVLLAELVEDRRLKIEVVPGKTAASVAGFTSAAQIYER